MIGDLELPMKKFIALSFLALMQTTLASAETCSNLQKAANADLASAQKATAAFNDGFNRVFVPFCQEFRTASACNGIIALINRNPHNAQFSAEYAPLLNAAIRQGSMNSREANAFDGLVITIRNNHYTAKILRAESAKKVAQMNTQKCTSILTFTAMTDVALVAESAKDKVGHCKVIAKKVQGRNEYILSVSGEDYPIKGVTYASIAEVATALREALDAGSCL